MATLPQNNMILSVELLRKILAEAVERGIRKKAPAKGFKATYVYPDIGKCVPCETSKIEAAEMLRQIIKLMPTKPQMEVIKKPELILPNNPAPGLILPQKVTL